MCDLEKLATVIQESNLAERTFTELASLHHVYEEFLNQAHKALVDMETCEDVDSAKEHFQIQFCDTATAFWSDALKTGVSQAVLSQYLERMLRAALSAVVPWTDDKDSLFATLRGEKARNIANHMNLNFLLEIFLSSSDDATQLYGAILGDTDDTSTVRRISEMVAKCIFGWFEISG
eukprot:SAG11_NODE_8363_length_1024_cov_1.495135_2_plen_176_part_01